MFICTQKTVQTMTNHTLQKQLFQTGCILAGVAVILGAFGAHNLKESVSDYELSIFETAVRYQFYHAFALLFISVFIRRLHERTAKTAGQLFLAGTLIFSGSLYILSISSLWEGGEGTRWLGGVTPFGGAALIAGWAYLAYSGYKVSGSSEQSTHYRHNRKKEGASKLNEEQEI